MIVIIHGTKSVSKCEQIYRKVFLSFLYCSMYLLARTIYAVISSVGRVSWIEYSITNVFIKLNPSALRPHQSSLVDVPRRLALQGSVLLFVALQIISQPRLFFSPHGKVQPDIKSFLFICHQASRFPRRSAKERSHDLKKCEQTKGWWTEQTKSPIKRSGKASDLLSAHFCQKKQPILVVFFLRSFKSHVKNMLCLTLF